MKKLVAPSMELQRKYASSHGVRQPVWKRAMLADDRASREVRYGWKRPL